MLKRIITSIFALAVLLPVLFLSETWVFPIALAIVSVMCLFEMLRCMGMHKNMAVTIPLYVFAVSFPILQKLFVNDMYVAIIAFMAGVVYVIYTFALVVWSHGKLTYNNACSVCLTCFYILISMNMIQYIRDFGDSGQFVYLLIFVGAWVTDVFAYFTGVFFGKHKLIEDVSPKKTIEGSIGGTVFCSLAFVLVGIIVRNFFGRDANLIFLAISGIIMAVIAQVGDLILSVIKRHYGIKDYGKIFPGHGGMLDRFDSIMAVTLGVALMCMFSYITGIPLM